MLKDQLKSEIVKVLDHFTNETLEELLSFLKRLDEKVIDKSTVNSLLIKKIIEEDSSLLKRLAL